MEARNVEQAEEATYVDYKDFVRDLVIKSPTTPDAAFILKNLLQQYIANAKVPYKVQTLLLGSISYKNRAFTHTKDADQLLQCFDDNDWLKNTLTTIGSKFTEAIHSGTEFGLMLTPFFKTYPEHIHFLQSEAARKKVITEAQLCPGAGTFADWQASFQQNHIDGKCSEDYEVLSHYAELIPKSMAVDYATFLLKQLRTKGKFPNEPAENAQRPEEYSGMYAGWVCVALSKLVNKLEPNQKKDVCGYLIKELEKTDLKSLTNIGLCLALSALSTDAETKAKTVERLHKFLGDQLRNKQTGINLTIEFQSDVSSVSTYMPFLFHAMLNLGNEAKTQSKALVLEILLDPQYLYAYRQGLSILFDWLEPRDLETFYDVLSHDSAAGVQKHPQFAEIIPLFWQRMTLDPKGVKINSIVDKSYIQVYQAALAELTNPNSNTKWTDCHQLVTSGRAWETDTSTMLAKIKTLIKELPNYLKTPKEHLIAAALRDLPYFMQYFAAHEKVEYCKLICDNFLPPNCSNLELNTLALKTALTLRSHSNENDLAVYLNKLLALLKQQHTLLSQYMTGKPMVMPSADLINEMLTEVMTQANKMPAAKIPALMLFLETLGKTGEPIVDEKMHLVLGNILKLYPAKIKEFFSSMAPVPVPVAQVPKPTASGGTTE